MRERERLEDFGGGHVACRGCKRLIYFNVAQALRDEPPVICCGMAYVPTRQQWDLLIYDKLQPGDFPGAQHVPAPGAVQITAPDNTEALAVLDGSEFQALPPLSDAPFPGVEEYVLSPTDETDLETLMVTPAEALARKKARVADLKRRGRIDYG